jgi:hypothetical protein
MHDAADDTAIIHSLLAPNIGWQMRLDPRPLLIAQPEQIPAHQSFPQIRINIVLSTRKN